MNIIDTNIKLIELVKKHECLYNIHNPQYKQLEYRENVWRNIGKELGITTEKVKNKWKNLRDSHKKRLNKLNQQGAAIHKQYKYADELKFLNIIFQQPVITKADLEVSTDLSSDSEYQTNFDIDAMEEFIEESPTTNEKCQAIHFPTSSDVQVFSISVLNEENDLTNRERNTDNVLNEEHEDNEEHQVASEVNYKCAKSSEVVEEEQEKDLHYMLIEEVKKHECIYNMSSPQYNDFEYKKVLWYNIGKGLGLSSKTAKNKWKSVKDAYRKYKHKTLTTSGFVKTYKYAEILKFLDNYTTERISRFSLPSIPEPEVSTDLLDDDNDDGVLQRDSLRHNNKTYFEKSFAKNVNSEHVNPKAITSRLFMLLANKINEANLSPQQRNDIEFTVSSIVYTKLGKLNKKYDI